MSSSSCCFSSCRTLRDDRELHIHPNSVLYGEKPPKWSVCFGLLTRPVCCSELQLHWLSVHCRVIFNEVVQTSKYYMRDVTAVESSWLVELAPHYYKQAKVGPWTRVCWGLPVRCLHVLCSSCLSLSMFSICFMLSMCLLGSIHVIHVFYDLPFSICLQGCLLGMSC